MSEENKEQLEEEKSELRQDDVSNDMTRSILRNNNFEVPTQDVVIKDGDKKDKTESAKIENEEQVEEKEVVAITEDDIKVLEEAGISEESLDGKTISEIKVIAQDAREKQTTVVDDSTQGQPTVSIEDATKVGGFAGNLIGKTPVELLEIINNQNSHIGTLSEKKSTKEVDSLNQQNLNIEDDDTDASQEAVDLLSLPAKEQAIHLAKIIKEQVDAGIKEGLSKSPELESARVQASKAHLVEFHTVLGKALPEDITTPEQAEEVFNKWKVAVKDTYTKKELQALAQTPNVLITLISDHYKLNNKVIPPVKKDDKNTDKAVKKSESQSYQRMRSMIEKAPAGETKFNFKRKAIEDNESDLLSAEGSEEQQMIGRILERNLPN